MKKIMLLLLGVFTFFISEAQLSTKDSLKMEKIEKKFQKGGENIIKAIDKLDPIFTANENVPFVWERMLKYKIAYYDYCPDFGNGGLGQMAKQMNEAGRPRKLDELIQLLKRATEKKLAIKELCQTIKKVEELSIVGGQVPNYANTADDLKKVKANSNCN